MVVFETYVQKQKAKCDVGVNAASVQVEGTGNTRFTQQLQCLGRSCFPWKIDYPLSFNTQHCGRFIDYTSKEPTN